MFPTKRVATRLQQAALCALASVSLFSSPPASANTPPTIRGKPATHVMVAHDYTFLPSASDPDHEKLTFSIRNKPWWARFDSSTGKLYGKPQHAATFRDIVICVSHGTYRRCLPAFAVKVLQPPDAPPVITGTPPAIATVGSTYSFQPRGHDPHGLPITFGISDKPAWLSFNRATGRLSGRPTEADVGRYSHIGITVSNGYRSAQLAFFSITVPTQGAELPPSAVTIAWTPPTENTNGTALTNLAGYHLYYGTTESDLSKVVDITNPGLATYVLSDLSSGTWYFALTSVNTAGVESVRSAVISTVVQ